MLLKLTRLARVPVPSESLAFFRIIFGLLMVVAEGRFISRGWVNAFYIEPQYYFTFYGFEWIKPLADPFMHWVFYALFMLSLMIALGLFYRFSIITFFFLFTYVELIDKSVYLNHYYQISLLAALMCWLPMNAKYALDNHIFKSSVRNDVPCWMIWALRLQVGLVYFFGGVAKLRYDWLLEAQPLRIWLSASQDFPMIGHLFTQEWVAYVLSWFAMLFDLTAAFFLSRKSTRVGMYCVVVIFHLLTHFLFYIGMFPWMMIFTALIFFSPEFHQTILRSIFGRSEQRELSIAEPPKVTRMAFMLCFFCFQFIMPIRSYAYPGNVLWHEQGYRFAWNIMLMEKNASLEYEVTVRKTGQKFTVSPSKLLTKIQARQCSFQPDMILQFAHILHRYYLDAGLGETEIRAFCHASVNGHESRLLINPAINLINETDGFDHKTWILPDHE